MYGKGHSERKDFAKSAWRDVIGSYENALLSINLTSREKVSEHWGN